jgi:transcriptional regulator with XRE-family HTH domain
MNLVDLGHRIKTSREKRRLTQRQLADTLFISPQAVSKWERGENAPDISLLKPLSALLEVNLDWLLGGDEVIDRSFMATVLCTSLRHYASDATALPSHDLALRMNTIFHGLTETVLAFNGVPIKYVGDGFLAYFSGDRHADRALESVLRAKRVLSEASLLMTLNSGEIYLGTIGHPDYSRLDIMGDTVNVAFLINQWANQAVREDVVVSEHTHALLTAPLADHQIHHKISINPTHSVTVYLV